MKVYQFMGCDQYESTCIFEFLEGYFEKNFVSVKSVCKYL